MFKKILSLFLLIVTITLSETINVKGTLKFKDINLGGVKIEFIASDNSILTTESDIFGNFEIKLPNKKYRVGIADYGYKIEEKQDIIYDFTNTQKTYFLEFSLLEKNGFISGKVLSKNLMPISNSEISIKYGTNKKTLNTDYNGNFSVELPPGIVTLTFNSEGFQDVTIVKNLPRASSIKNLLITLKPLRYKISGIVSDGVKSLSNIDISIYNLDGELMATVKTSETGYYEFLELEGYKEFYIKINNPNYSVFDSERIILKNNLTSNYIVLKPSNNSEKSEENSELVNNENTNINANIENSVINSDIKKEQN